jgi:hypothetical protein
MRLIKSNFIRMNEHETCKLTRNKIPLPPKKIVQNKRGNEVEKPGLVVRAEAHFQDVMGSNPAVYWMDVSDAGFYIFNENGNKGSQMGHTKKIIIMIIFFF